MPDSKIPDIIEFNRPKKYSFIKTLGHGSCGQTVLVRDEEMDCNFVVKKYSPQEGLTVEAEALQLRERFKQEAQILFRLSHPNIVRVFNFWDYPDAGSSFILMEHVQGRELHLAVQMDPLILEPVFRSVVEGFVHVEAAGILHRDIRPQNIMIDEHGSAKIIDFGFGKSLEHQNDDRKSISLNWWCPVPPEFSDDIYDSQTEVYFVGKLFEKVMEDHGLEGFEYSEIVQAMIEPDRQRRLGSFRQVTAMLEKGGSGREGFSDEQKMAYKRFADQMIDAISSIDSDAILVDDLEKVINRLDELYLKSMLEDDIASSNLAIRIFIDGSFRYYKNSKVSVSAVFDFLRLLKSLPQHRALIVIRNLRSRLESIERQSSSPLDDEIPF